MKQIPVLIDCDTGIDDILALTVALSNTHLDVKGITTVAGNQKLELTTYNTLNALELMGRTEIPLAQGASKPLCRALVDAGEIHGESGLGNYSFSKPTSKEPVQESAVHFMNQIITESKEPITILALGPLTNIGNLFAIYPKTKEKIERIIFMGGSIRTGNPTPITTFNVLVDPEAAKEVFKSGVPFHMVPLDTTRMGYLAAEEVEDITKINNPVAKMAYEVIQFYLGTSGKELVTHYGLNRVSIHDLCTVVYMTNPELFTSVKYYADVETKGEITTGFTMIDYEDKLKKSDEEKNIVYVNSINREGFKKVFFDALKSYNK